MAKKLRVVAYQVQPILFADDGENLEPVEVQPMVIKSKDLADFDWDNALAPVRAQVEGYPEVTP